MDGSRWLRGFARHYKLAFGMSVVLTTTLVFAVFGGLVLLAMDSLRNENVSDHHLRLQLTSMFVLFTLSVFILIFCFGAAWSILRTDPYVRVLSVPAETLPSRDAFDKNCHENNA